jgi:hypothetical protein
MKQMKLERYQERKLNSFNQVNRIWIDDKKLFVQLAPAYSWTADSFVHTKSFGSFDDALAALRKFK